MRKVAYLAVAAVLAGVGLAGSLQADEEKPKFTIKEVMAQGHKGNPNLYSKVAAGKATKEEKEKLVELYTALPLSKPPKGDEKAWKDKTEALLKDAKAVLADEKDATKALAKSANCKSCHDAHQAKK